ncbi:MAG: hypothetical protein AB2417_17990 [Clostridiaceae bacterium]
MNKNCFVSWSGGKDSCLALYKAMEQGYNVKKLFTMFSYLKILYTYNMVRSISRDSKLEIVEYLS